MAGLIAALFGGKNKPVDTNPHPGIGGYTLPRGPYGEGGFPGSAPAAPPTHPQTAEGIPQRKLTATQAQNEWDNLPPRRLNGTPQQPYARDMAQADDTEKRSSPILARDIPGDSNQRNTVYYGGRKAAPGMLREYLSSGNPAKPPEPVIVPDRYVFDGPNGGFESYAVDRRIPYRIHARPKGYRGAPSNRGADLSGQRYTMASKEVILGLPDGHYGIHRARGPNHRPVKFTRPAPWSENYYDMAPREGTQSPDMIYQSPSSRKAPVKHATRPHELEHRRHPEVRGRRRERHRGRG
jgi:hypothetical protein